MAVFDADLAALAVRTYPLSRRDDVHFADAVLDIEHSGGRTSIGASSLGVGRTQVTARCTNELLERWAFFEWERTGSPRLEMTDLLTGTTSVGLPLVAGPRRDATGVCAGPIAARDTVLLHGLLEVLERDAVTRLLDGAEGVTRQIEVTPPAQLTRLARRWGGELTFFSVGADVLPPVVLAVFAKRDVSSGAIGAACRPTAAAACAHAAAEALMMYTTARHWQRRDDVPAGYHGVVWAAQHIAELIDELRELGAPAGGKAERLPSSVQEVAAVAAATHLGSPRVCELPLGSARFLATGVWRVLLPGARTPATATRHPWPLG